MDTVDWPVQNSIRNDVIAQWHSDRFGTNSMGLLPFAWDENIFSKWNANPFQMDGGSGMTEFNPGVYLLPYWMMVYHAYMN